MQTSCHGLFAFSLGDTGRPCSKIVSIPRHLLYYFCVIQKIERTPRGGFIEVNLYAQVLC